MTCPFCGKQYCMCILEHAKKGDVIVSDGEPKQRFSLASILVKVTDWGEKVSVSDLADRIEGYYPSMTYSERCGMVQRHLVHEGQKRFKPAETTKGRRRPTCWARYR